VTAARPRSTGPKPIPLDQGTRSVLRWVHNNLGATPEGVELVRGFARAAATDALPEVSARMTAAADLLDVARGAAEHGMRNWAASDHARAVRTVQNAMADYYRRVVERRAAAQTG